MPHQNTYIWIINVCKSTFYDIHLLRPWNYIVQSTDSMCWAFFKLFSSFSSFSSAKQFFHFIYFMYLRQLTVENTMILLTYTYNAHVLCMLYVLIQYTQKYYGQHKWIVVKKYRCDGHKWIYGTQHTKYNIPNNSEPWYNVHIVIMSIYISIPYIRNIVINEWKIKILSGKRHTQRNTHLKFYKFYDGTPTWCIVFNQYVISI